MTHFGIPCADNIGVSGDYIHSKNEFAYLKSLKESAKMLGAIALSIE